MPWKPKTDAQKSPSRQAAQERAAQDRDRFRGSAAARGYDRRWRDYRAAYLHRHPMCAECSRHGVHRFAEVIDHITPHRGNMRLFWDPANHQPLCRPCHDSKTGKGE